MITVTQAVAQEHARIDMLLCTDTNHPALYNEEEWYFSIAEIVQDGDTLFALCFSEDDTQGYPHYFISCFSQQELYKEMTFREVEDILEYVLSCAFCKGDEILILHNWEIETIQCLYSDLWTLYLCQDSHNDIDFTQDTRIALTHTLHSLEQKRIRG